jgi:hypothetical protein
MKNQPLVPLALALLAALAAGCATSQGTLSSGPAYVSARDAVLAADTAAAPDCATRRLARTETVEKPRVSVNAYDAAYTDSLPSAGQAPSYAFGSTPKSGRRYSQFVERWTVERCGQSVPYLVTFKPDEAGGYDVAVAAEK